MSFEREAILARLFGDKGETSGSGGTLFPEVFTGILELIWKNGPSTEKFIHHEIKGLFEHKIKRIRDRWGSMEAYTRDMLYILANGGYIAPDGELWSLTEKAVPDTRLEIIKIPGRAESRLRITFHDTRNREEKEAVAIAWQEIGKYIRSLDGNTEVPVLRKARDWALEIQEILQEAIQHPGTLLEIEAALPGSKTPRAAGSVTTWAREWIRAAGWYTDHEGWLAWNRAHPDDQFVNSSVCSVRNVTRAMEKKGEIERRTVRYKRDNCHTEFRYLGD